MSAMPADLTEADRAILAALLRETIAADRFPLSQRVKTLRAILDKLDPPPVREVRPPPKPPGEPSRPARKRRR
jgi:hypothetical protein